MDKLHACVLLITNVCRPALVGMAWLKDNMLLKITTAVAIGMLLLYYPTAQPQTEIGEHSINLITILVIVMPW